MKNQPIRILVAFALLASIGIFLVQGYWFKEAFKTKKAEFDFQVFSSLKQIATEIADLNGIMLPSENPVEQVSSNYFVVMINDVIDPSALEALLLRNFRKLGIEEDFQYGIYDCLTDQMVYSNKLNAFDDPKKENAEVQEPEFSNDNYYFSVYFPGIQSVLIGSMGIWIFSSLILLMVIIFFAWAAIIILKQRRLSEIHTDFVNNLTHEMKTPLSSMTLALERLGDRQTEDTRSLEILNEELLNLKGKIEHILDSVRSDQAKEKGRAEKFDLGLWVREIIDPERNYPERNILLEIERDCLINGNKEQIKSLVNNLVSNALNHGAEPVTVEVRRSNRSVKLIVSDQGSGIAEEHQKRVYDKFYRVPKGNIYREKGFGLGLFLVKSIVRNHKAKIRLKSSETGTSFEIEFGSI